MDLNEIPLNSAILRHYYSDSFLYLMLMSMASVVPVSEFNWSFCLSDDEISKISSVTPTFYLA